ncbi:MAG: bifunctional phosphoribosylaminoimidazolecarboxamide formyltransferase/IMP cyclohydrolase [Opitutae bacterium]|nr:bifunctional phosphoribosylaminoimidazolecarboxamide formyltransferase/IMP cyclohydrolase [Opitutae bacterium]
MEKFALLSVSDKTGIVPFARSLVEESGFTLLSTGGTAGLLRDNGIPVTDVSEHTGFPEMMDGRVKTLHPKIHGGLLCLRDNDQHREAAADHNLKMIDLVVVNLYPFEDTVAKSGVSLEEAIEQIDIGGPSMLRSAAKNHKDVTVVCDPSDYGRVLDSMKSGEGLVSLRKELALKVFLKTSAYDGAISAYLNSQYRSTPDLGEISGFPENLDLKAKKSMVLRYGENPHQQASLYGDLLDHFTQLQGKELSYNNILDISASAYLIGEFERPTVAILKHTNPCGVSSADDLEVAWERAFETDRQAPFGGIIVVNNTVDVPLAEMIGEIFCEVIIAPGFTESAMSVFERKKNLRLLVSKSGFGAETLREYRTVPGGLLAQDRDQKRIKPKEFEVVTERQPTELEWRSMLFGWKVVRHVKSNAIVYAGDERTLGVGAGQMSRVDSSRIAVWKAGEAGLSLEGSSVASDAFFPFADGLIAAADAGATAAIQPGGSVRDEDVIAAANDKGMTMVFTGSRHFKH